MKIKFETAEKMLDIAAFVLCHFIDHNEFSNVDEMADYAKEEATKFFLLYCENEGITTVEEEEK